MTCIVEQITMQDNTTYKISDFDYDLPQVLIAQTPIEPRDASRLLVVHRDTGIFVHRNFRDIGEYLRPGDLLIANQSRVLPARLLGHRAETGGAVEVLLLVERLDLGHDYWETLVRPGRRLRKGSIVEFYNANRECRLLAEIGERTEADGRIVHLCVPHNVQQAAATNNPYDVTAVRQRIDELGRMPLPPYIHETLEDPERYQTV